jgi:hypothetical protein
MPPISKGLATPEPATRHHRFARYDLATLPSGRLLSTSRRCPAPALDSATLPGDGRLGRIALACVAQRGNQIFGRPPLAVIGSTKRAVMIPSVPTTNVAGIGGFHVSFT